jgi:hypothetical protein
LTRARQSYDDLPGFCPVGDCFANFFDVKDAGKVLEEEQRKFNWFLPLAPSLSESTVAGAL